MFENTKNYGSKIITLKISENAEGGFVRWAVYGNYSALGGGLTATSFKFIPHSDIKVKAVFKDKTKNTVKTNNSLNSPKTGKQYMCT